MKSDVKSLWIAIRLMLIVNIFIIILALFACWHALQTKVGLEGCISVKNQSELNEAFDLLLQNEDERFEKGHICSTFVQMNKGATTIILKHILNDSI